MRINQEDLKLIINKYKNNLINHRIIDFELVNSRLFLLTLDKTNLKLIIDLDNLNPHIGMIDIKFNELPLPSNFINKLKGKGNPKIIDISTVNNDRVVKINTLSTDAFYHKQIFNLYIELMPAHANMILTDNQDKIITAFYETNINSPRLIIPNNKYILPDKKEIIEDNHQFDINKYDEYVINSFNESLKKRKNEIYKNQIKELKKKEKNIIKKIDFAKNDLLKAENAEIYKDYGNTILMNKNSIKQGDEDFEGIKLDKRKSVIENANSYFNKYKKLKRSVDILNKLLIDLNRELEDVRYKSSIIDLGEEKDINNLIINKGRKNKDAPSQNPYVIKYNDMNIYYGLNKYENDYLTFKLFNQNSKSTWFHLNNIPSPHMIVNKEDINDNSMDILCSLYLLISKKSAGEIMIAKRCDITRSNNIGEANIKNYKLIKLNKINEIAYKLIKTSKKYN